MRLPGKLTIRHRASILTVVVIGRHEFVPELEKPDVLIAHRHLVVQPGQSHVVNEPNIGETQADNNEHHK